MACGVQLFNEKGNIVMDTNDLLGVIVGNFVVADIGSGSLQDAGLLSRNNTFIFIVQTSQGTALSKPNVTIKGSTISWMYSIQQHFETKQQFMIFYGTY